MSNFFADVWRDAEPHIRNILAEALITAAFPFGLTLFAVPVLIGKYMGVLSESRAHMLEDVHFFCTMAAMGVFGVSTVWKLARGQFRRPI